METMGATDPLARKSALQAAARSDRHLIALAQDGDTEAFGVLYRRHRGTVNAVCRRLLGDPHAAEDAVQEVFARALKALPDSKPDTNVRSWLKRIAHNLCIDLLRERRRRPESQLGVADALIVDHHTGAEFEKCDNQQTAIRLLRRLNERDGRALLLHDGYGVPLRELAVRFHTTEASLAVILHRVRARARQVMSSPMGVIWPFAIMKRFGRWTARQTDSGYSSTTMAAVSTTVALALVLVVPMTPAAPDVPSTRTAGEAGDVGHTTLPTHDGSDANDVRGKSRRQIEDISADVNAASRGATRPERREPVKPPPYVDMDSVDVPLVERPVGTRRPPGDPDYDYGVRAKALDEEVHVGIESYDDPEQQTVDETACRAASAENPVTYCHTDEQ